MKIIGPRDYYDYLVGTYGLDNHIVLDRRGGEKMFSPKPFSRESGPYYEQVQVYFCDCLYYGVIRWPSGVCAWGADIETLGEAVKGTYWNRNNAPRVKVVEKSTRQTQYFYYATETTKVNKEQDCPILLDLGNGEYQRYPIGLAEFGFASLVDPDLAYLELYRWLSARKTEQINDVLTDKQKVTAKGFDNVVSFRKRKPTSG